MATGMLRERAVRTMMYDLSFAIRVTQHLPEAADAETQRQCQGRLLSVLASSPPVFGGLLNRTNLCANPAEGQLAIQPWRQQKNVFAPPWMLMDQELVAPRVSLLADYVEAAGLWRSMTVCIGDDGAQADSGTDLRMLTATEIKEARAGAPLTRTAWHTDEHDDAVRSFGDVLDITIAQEAALAGVGVLPWMRRALFGNEDAALAAVTRPTPLGDTSDGAAAWTLLGRMADHVELSRTFAEWRGKDEARSRLTMVDLARAMHGEAYGAGHAFGSDTARNEAVALAAAAGLQAPTEEDARVGGRTFLASLAWMAEVNRVSPQNPRDWIDVACRLRSAEEKLGTPPERLAALAVRGATLESRDLWLRSLHSQAEVFRYQLAACLAERNPMLRDNILRSAVLERLHATAWPNPFSIYEEGLRSSDGRLLHRDLLAGWPLAKVDGRWSLIVRSVDGRRIAWALPTVEVMRAGQIAYGPAMASLQLARERLAEQRLLFGSPAAAGGDSQGADAFLRAAMIRFQAQAPR